MWNPWARRAVGMPDAPISQLQQDAAKGSCLSTVMATSTLMGGAVTADVTVAATATDFVVVFTNTASADISAASY